MTTNPIVLYSTNYVHTLYQMPVDILTIPILFTFTVICFVIHVIRVGKSGVPAAKPMPPESVKDFSTQYIVDNCFCGLLINNNNYSGSVIASVSTSTVHSQVMFYEVERHGAFFPPLPGPECSSEGGDAVADGQQHGGRDRRAHHDLPKAAKHLPRYYLMA